MTSKSIIATITAIFFIFSMFYPKVAKANPWSSAVLSIVKQSDDEEKITPMKIGDKAPYPGILFSTAAAAKIETDQEMAEEKCQLKIDKDVSLEKAKFDLLLANEKAAKASAQERLKEIRKIKDDQILFMTKQMEKQQKKEKRVENLTGLWIAVGVVGGLLVGVSSAYIYSRIN